MKMLTIVRSDKLKPFWLSMVDEDLSTFNWLCGALMSRELTDEYREAVSRSLDIPDCKVVPFFGGFLRDLRSLFINVPSIIVLPSEENQSLEVNWQDMKFFLLWNPLFHLRQRDLVFKPNLTSPSIFVPKIMFVIQFVLKTDRLKEYYQSMKLFWNAPYLKF